MTFESVKIAKRGRLTANFPVAAKAYRTGGRTVVEFRLSDPFAAQLKIGTEFQFCELRRGIGQDGGRFLLRPTSNPTEWEWHFLTGYCKISVRGERIGFDNPFPLTPVEHNIGDCPEGGEAKCLFVNMV